MCTSQHYLGMKGVRNQVVLCSDVFTLECAAARAYALSPEDLASKPKDGQQVMYILDVVKQLNSLLQKHPIMHKPGADADNSNPPGYKCVMPTPSPAVWRDIETIALRAFNTLDWVCRQLFTQRFLHGHDKPSDIPGCEDLATQLVLLLQAVLIGHLPDMQLDMARLYKDGLHAVLLAQQLMASSQVITIPVLQRLAQDVRLVTKQSADDTLLLDTLPGASGVFEQMLITLGKHSQ